VEDLDEMSPEPILIDHITNDEDGLVSCLVDKKHGLQVGNKVTFYEVCNMENLGTRTVTKLESAAKFCIGSTKGKTNSSRTLRTYFR